MNGRQSAAQDPAADRAVPAADLDFDAQRHADETDDTDETDDAVGSDVDVPLDPPADVPVADYVDQLRAVPLDADEDR